MHLTWVTDPHLNFVSPRKVAAFIADVAATQPDAVLLGGDVGEADDVTSLLETLAAAWAKPIYFVLGNHDFYHGSVASVRAGVRALAERLPNLTYLSASAPVWLPGGMLLVGTDGWGDGGFGDATGSKVRSCSSRSCTPPLRVQNAWLCWRSWDANLPNTCGRVCPRNWHTPSEPFA